MQPLAGLKVLDLSTLLPGPYATMLLADLGAEVLRVESPARPDLVRQMRPQIDGQSAAFGYLNRGKRSLALDLKHPDANAVIRRLVAEYDILVEQFRPGVMARLGLDYDSLAEVNPRLIYCSITGYGQSGPYRDKAGHDINFLALSGVASHMGRQAEGPAPLGIQVADIAAGSHPAVIGILAAVIERGRTGQGRQLDISMADNAFALQALLAPGALNGEPDPQAESHFLNGGGFYDFYRTRDGRYMAVGSLEPQFRQRLIEALGQPELAALTDAELKVALTDLFARQDFDHWCRCFAEVDACVEPVLGISEAAQHPQFTERGLIQRAAGGERQIGCAIRFADRPLPTPGPAPRLGQHNAEVMAQLGYTATQIQEFNSAGLFG